MCPRFDKVEDAGDARCGWIVTFKVVDTNRVVVMESFAEFFDLEEVDGPSDVLHLCKYIAQQRKTRFRF